MSLLSMRAAALGCVLAFPPAALGQPAAPAAPAAPASPVPAATTPPIAAPAAPPGAEQEKAAKEAYAAAKEAYKNGDFDAAVENFDRAYQAWPRPELLYNLARAYEQMGNLSAAIAFYERYLEKKPDAQDKDAVTATVVRLREANQLANKALREAASGFAKRGRAFYQAGKYKEALGQLQQAHRLMPSGGLIYNIARCRERLKDYDQAIRDYRVYLQMEPNAPDRGDVENVIKELEATSRPPTQELSIESTPPGADVWLDGKTELAGQTPLKVSMTKGHHAFSVQKNGQESVKREFEMPADRPLTLNVEMRPLTDNGFLELEVVPDGTQVFLDGTIVAITPYKEQRALSSGRHQVILEQQGYQRYVRVVDVKRDRVTRLRVSLEQSGGRPVWPAVLFGAAGVTGALLALVAGSTTALVAGVYASNSVRETAGWMRAVGVGAAALAVAGVFIVACAFVGGGGMTAWLLYALLPRDSGEVSDVSVPVAVPPVVPAAPPPTAETPPPGPAPGAPVVETAPVPAVAAPAAAPTSPPPAPPAPAPSKEGPAKDAGRGKSKRSK